MTTKPKFYWENKTIYESVTEHGDNCADCFFYNEGADSVTINGMTLSTGQTASFAAQKDEENTGNFNLNFVTTVAPKLHFWRKYYKK